MPDLSLPVAGDPRDGAEGGSTEVEIAAATVELYNELKGSESAAGLATLQAILDGTYAPVEDAALTGTPTAPTAAPGTDTTQVATTEFVKDAVDNATSGMALGFPATSDPKWIMSKTVQPTFNSPNRSSWWRVIGDRLTVTKLGLHVTTSGGNICLGVARSAPGRSTAGIARTATSGSVPCPAAGYAEVAMDVAVEVVPGIDWFGLSADTATPTFWGETDTGWGYTNLMAGRAFFQDSAFPLPATPNPGGAALGYNSRPTTIIGVA